MPARGTVGWVDVLHAAKLRRRTSKLLQFVRGATFGRGALRGRFRLPGDKSISHRAVIVAALSDKPVEIRNLNGGRDVAATAAALRSLGARVTSSGELTVVQGGSLHDPAATLECENSGSTARMMMGVCAGAALRAHFDGDASLRRRLMEPIAAQLRAFGARLETTNGYLPATLDGPTRPQTRRFILLTPSAQIKSALLFAGLFANVPVATLADPGSRDHTERLLRYLGADIASDRATVELRSRPKNFRPIEIPGDFSTAAAFITAATIAPQSAVIVESVGVNPTRTGLLDALEAMGGRISLERRRDACGESVADIAVESAQLRGVSFGSELALRSMDELLLLAVAAAHADGNTTIAGVRELRAKESDRLSALARLLSAAGIETETEANSVVIRGGQPDATGALVETLGDHRVAMGAAALAAAGGPLSIDDADCIAISAPNFLDVWPLTLTQG